MNVAGGQTPFRKEGYILAAEPQPPRPPGPPSWLRHCLPPGPDGVTPVPSSLGRRQTFHPSNEFLFVFLRFEIVSHTVKEIVVTGFAVLFDCCTRHFWPLWGRRSRCLSAFGLGFYLERWLYAVPYL